MRIIIISTLKISYCEVYYSHARLGKQPSHFKVGGNALEIHFMLNDLRQTTANQTDTH